MTRTIYADIAIIGSSLGGCAALMTPYLNQDPVPRIALVTVDEWLGGQVSAQGVSPLDEHDYIETFGGTATYQQFRENVRARYDLPDPMPESVLGPNRRMNPGNGWVSRLCFPPNVAAEVIEAMLPDHVEIVRGVTMTGSKDTNTLLTVLFGKDTDGEKVEIVAEYFIDATDEGDLLPATKTAYVTGAEARQKSHEPSARRLPRPGEVQAFTFPFAVEFCPGQDHTIAKPEGYEQFRDEQPYTLAPVGRDGNPVIYKMFETSEQGNPPFWTYRRVHDGALLGGNDIALINWVSNDYHGGNILDASAEDRARYLDEAKRLSLGFLYWLQTECPRDDGGTGYPELKLRPDIMGSEDGLSQRPYIRESRRIVAKERVAERDIAAEYNDGARAKHHENSVGIGWYAMDLHPAVGNPTKSMYAPTRPFQIPLGALVPEKTVNLLAACKNIGTTHLTNGAYRLHPVEWAIGEAAGVIAAACQRHSCMPYDFFRESWLMWCLQRSLVETGCPIFWAVDVPVGHPLFVVTQLLLVRGIIREGSARWHSLVIAPDDPLGDDFDFDKLATITEELNAMSRIGPVDFAPVSPDWSWKQLCAHYETVIMQELRLD